MGNPQEGHDEEVQASRRVLVEVLQVLGSERDRGALIVVGGWIPELMFPGQGHIGSVDVDLVLDPHRIPIRAYGTIKDRLIAAGYRLKYPDVTNVFERDVEQSGQSITVKIDLLAGDVGKPGEDRSIVHVDGMNFEQMKGIELALSHHIDLEITDMLPDGGKRTQKAKVAALPAFICMKAIAMDERMKTKDAYDIHFCMRHHPDGPKGLARLFTPLRGIALVEEAIAMLRVLFQSIDHTGPVWAGQEAAEHGGDEAVARQDAFQRMQTFLSAIDERR